MNKCIRPERWARSWQFVARIRSVDWEPFLGFLSKEALIVCFGSRAWTQGVVVHHGELESDMCGQNVLDGEGKEGGWSKVLSQ